MSEVCLRFGLLGFILAQHVLRWMRWEVMAKSCIPARPGRRKREKEKFVLTQKKTQNNFRGCVLLGPIVLTHIAGAWSNGTGTSEARSSSDGDIGKKIWG